MVQTTLGATPPDAKWRIVFHERLAAPVACTRRSRDAALPLLRREGAMPADWPGVIRLAALCLSTDADSHQQRQLAELLREIAAG
jgi:hypothetical protein